MDVQKFTVTATAILRSTVGWQTAIAKRLGVDSRTVRRWLHDGAIPDWVEGKLSDMIGGRDIAPWPRDEWLIGDAFGGDGKCREYIMHMQFPRFIARVVATGDDGKPEAGEEPADVDSGVVYAADSNTVLCEIEWIDPIRCGERVNWLEAASEHLDIAGGFNQSEGALKQTM